MPSPRLPRRFWTPDELATVRELYPATTAAEIAKRLGRTPRAVYQAVTAMGLNKIERTPITDTFRDTVRRLNAEGYPDREIADTFGCERHTVSRHRKAMGLPSQARSGRYRERVKVRTIAQCEVAGVPTLAAVRSKAFRDFARSRGWPSELAPREVMMLEAMDASGPMTRRQLADALGMPWHGSRLSLKCKHGHGSYLANLVRAGLVINLGRLIKGAGKGRSACLYSLAPTAIRGENAS